jgi:hypothetical protein
MCAVGVVWVVKQHNPTASERDEVAAVGLFKHGLVKDKLCWPVGNHASREGNYIVKTLCGARKVMRSGHDGSTACRFGIKDVHDLFLGRGVDACDRFVKKINLRIGGDRACQEDPATLATRKFTDLPLREITHIHARERVSNRGVIGCPRSTEWPQCWRAPHHHHLANRNGKAPVNLLGLRYVRHTLRVHTNACPKHINTSAPRPH